MSTKSLAEKLPFLARAVVYLLAFAVPPVRSEHGLLFVPRYDLEGAPPLDRVLVPGRDDTSETDPAGRPWAQENDLKPEYVHADAPAGFPFDATLRDLAEHENAPVARFTARLLEYPTDHLSLTGGVWPFAHLLRPLAVGLLGLVAIAALDRLVLTPATKRLRRPPKGMGA